jgi:hypothetical protein
MAVVEEQHASGGPSVDDAQSLAQGASASPSVSPRLLTALFHKVLFVFQLPYIIIKAIKNTAGSRAECGASSKSYEEHSEGRSSSHIQNDISRPQVVIHNNIHNYYFTMDGNCKILQVGGNNWVDNYPPNFSPAFFTPRAQ